MSLLTEEYYKIDKEINGVSPTNYFNVISDKVNVKTFLEERWGSLKVNYLRRNHEGETVYSMCPLCKEVDEKSGNLTLSKDGNLFRCKSCKKGGDLVSFLCASEGFTPIQAANFLVSSMKNTFNEKEKTFIDENSQGRVVA